MRLLIVAELSRGGIADYAHDQAAAFASLGDEVEVLCSPDFLKDREIAYHAIPALRELRPAEPRASGLGRKLRLAAGILANAATVARHAGRTQPDAVLTHFSEYLAPLWAWRMRALRGPGMRFHSVLHDPVRDYAVGPRWWHALSVRAAFSFLDTVFVHTFEPVPTPSGVKAVYIPYGVHPFPKARRSRDVVRRELAIPASARVLTALGYIRDNKNLDLVIRAIAPMKEVLLLVAGSEQGGGAKPLAYYRDLAETLGCADRCRWLNRFMTAQEVADLLCASDLSVLTYSRSFVSSSAALSVTANYRLPCLISSGSSTTEAIVRRTGLGVWVEPDSADAIRAGLETWLRDGIQPDWDLFERENSWSRNAELAHQAMFAVGSND